MFLNRNTQHCQDVSSFLWSAVNACVHAKSLESCPTLCNLMNCSQPGSPDHRILQTRILEWVSMPSSKGSSQSRDRTCISYISCINRRVLYHQHYPGSTPVSCSIDISQSVLLLSRVWLFAAPQTAAHQASLSITNSQSLLKLMSIESMMPSNRLILCCPLLLLPSILPSIRVFSNESVLCIRWPKYRSFHFSISLSNEYSGLISFRIGWFDLPLAKELSQVFSNTTVQKHQFFGAQLYLWSSSHIHTRLLEKP